MLALLLALGSPELDVRGISVSYGNTVVENAYRNAVAIVRRAGKRTTLGVGARRPLAPPPAPSKPRAIGGPPARWARCWAFFSTSARRWTDCTPTSPSRSHW